MALSTCSRAETPYELASELAARVGATTQRRLLAEPTAPAGDAGPTPGCAACGTPT